jgi:hypothetical protein
MAAVLPLLPERHRAAPKAALLWTLGFAAVASCAVTVVLASINEELYQPALRVLLVWWVTLPFIFAGIVAWRRRPDSALGPLMILAGFVTCWLRRSGCTSSSPTPPVDWLGGQNEW